ncbi:MAG: hypothetical protein IT380_29880 [Myxococcales bacterium]|nr:hypothetical protein [Myxococcales bacterium]
MPARPSSWTRLTQVLKGLLPSKSVAPSVKLADEVRLRLEAGSSMGTVLRASFPVLAASAVDAASQRFEGGAVALLIVDVRDALAAITQGANLELSSRGRSWRGAAECLGQLSLAVGDDTFVQHLINTCLEATGVYTESMPLGPDAVDAARLTRAVAELLSRSLPAILSRAQLNQTAAGDDWSDPRGVQLPA